MSGILAALATIPGREFALERCLQSIRPQVDRIHLVCHDMEAPPECTKGLVDEVVCEPDTRGSAAKLHWARSHVGLYLGCDDDFIYPPDYVATMQRWVRRWKGRAIVTCHGRILKPESVEFGNVVRFWPPQGATEGAWLNYPGACAFAFDTRLNLPDRVPGKNLEESHLAVWAQENKVPIWLVPHPEGWLGYLLRDTDLPTIWAKEKRTSFASRNAVFAAHVANHPWRVHTC